MKVQKTVLTSRIDLLDVTADELYLIKQGLSMWAYKDYVANRGMGPEAEKADKLIKDLEMLSSPPTN